MEKQRSKTGRISVRRLLIFLFLFTTFPSFSQTLTSAMLRELRLSPAQNQQLQMQAYLSSLAASQNAQTAQLLNDNADQTATLLRQLNPVPVPAYVVSNPGCGCGYGNYYGCGA